MAKFYVESGEFRLIVQANTARGAAVWAVHRVLAQVLEVDDVPVPAAAAKGTTSGEAPSSPARLAETISVNQRGFARQDGQTFDSFALIGEWQELMQALAGLLERAGLLETPPCRLASHPEVLLSTFDEIAYQFIHKRRGG